MITYLFPGQGSQIKGMGGELFPIFPDITNQANAILGYDVKTLCLEDPETQLNQTQYTQPALYLVNALTYFKKLQDGGKEPDYVAGHSLGEYNALLAAGAFDFETGLKLVKKRGEFMSQAAGGAMAAIIGLKADQIKAILSEHALTNVAIANHNSHTQLILSGLKPDIDQAQVLCEQAGATMTLPLKVSGAFHSPYMREPQKEFETFLQSFQFKPLKLPVISNYTARPYTFSDIAHNLAQQISHPVRWTETIEYLINQGEMDFEEVGPGSVLTGLLRRIRNGQ